MDLARHAFAAAVVVIAIIGAFIGGVIGLAGGALVWGLLFVPLGGEAPAVLPWFVAGGCLLGAAGALYAAALRWIEGQA